MCDDRVVRSIALALVLGLATAAPAAADPKAQPWADGVTAAQKATAKEHLDVGNALFVEHKYADALEAYKLAIAAWDHPAIRFNMVRCLIQLDRPVDAADNLKLALKYGADPMEDSVYAEALAYEKLLATQVGDLEVTCTQPGVTVSLDGQTLGQCPINETRRMTPGQHLLVGTRPGFLTNTFEVIVIGGKHEKAAVLLKPLSEAATIEHRWATWKPWVVFASGFAVAGIGGLLELQAANDMDAFDRTIRHDCAGAPCAPGTVDTHQKTRAELENAIAVSVLSVGAATIATGAVLLYLDRARTVYPKTRERLLPGIEPLPGGGAAASLTFTFP